MSEPLASPAPIPVAPPPDPDPTQVYEFVCLLPAAWREHHPQLCLLERQRALAALAPYPGLCLIEEEELPGGALRVAYTKYPPALGWALLERRRQAREAAAREAFALDRAAAAAIQRERATVGGAPPLVAGRAITAGAAVVLDARGRVRAAGPPRGPRRVTAARYAELRLCAEIRDLVRHGWREATGQIPRGSPMASSWNEAEYAVWEPDGAKGDPDAV